MSIDFTSWQDKSAADHKKETDKAKLAGFRTVSLCVSGEVNNPRYAAVMVKRPNPHVEKQLIDVTAGSLIKAVQDMAKENLKPYTISATGPADNPLIAVTFRPGTEKALVLAEMTGSDLEIMNLDRWREEWIPVAIDAYGAPGDVRYAAIWKPNTARVTWNLVSASTAFDLPTYQKRFDAITVQGGRPTFVTMTPDGKYLGMFVDNAVGGWESRGELTAAKYQGMVDKHKPGGWAPLWMTAQGSGAQTRYSATFADREEPLAREFKVNGLIPSVEKIDSAIKKFMKDHSIRGCSLAIVKDTRLVYAKGYTLAEPGYPQTKPTTIFRMASCSKVFTAAAIYRLIQQGAVTSDGKPFTLETTMQTVLKLKTPDGKDPLSPQFKDITIRHLMESTSALNQSIIFWDKEAAATFGPDLPCTPAQMASYCASFSLQKDEAGNEKTPGDTTNVVYGNLDYFLLSQVIAKLSGSTTYEAALKKLLFTPLGITRIRSSRTLLANQEKDEARYHVVNVDPEHRVKDGVELADFTEYPHSLWVDNIRVAAGDAIVPAEYGFYNYELYDGTGGLSGAATDMARLLAVMSLRKNNPVFSEATLNNWFQNTVNTKPYTGPDKHGVHGFDWGELLDTTKPVSQAKNFGAAKGGWMPGASSAMIFRSEQYAFALVANSVGQVDVKTDWFADLNGDGVQEIDLDSVAGVTVKHSWGDVDHFPIFGMDPLPSNKKPAPGGIETAAKFFTAEKSLQKITNLVRGSVMEQRAKLPRGIARPAKK